MKTKVEVVKVYGVKYVAYYLEYFEEGVKEWLSAAGGWAEGVTVPGVIKDEAVARSIARGLSRTTGKVVRVVRESETR